MLSAYARFADGTSERCATVEALAAAWTRPNTVVWVDLENPTEEELRAIDAVIDVDDAALEDCLSGEQRPRIDEFDNYIFLVMYSAAGVEDMLGFAPRKLAAFCGERFLITVHHKGIRSVSDLRERCARHPHLILERGADFVLFTLIDAMVDYYVAVADRYEDQLEDLEEQSLSSAINDTILERVQEMRRDLLHLRRVGSSQRELIAPLARGECDYVSALLGQRFTHVADHLTQVVESADALRERLQGVRDNYHAAQTDRTNRAMKTLTALAVVLLPVSMLGSVYGMNLPLWPDPNRPMSFWLIVAAMAAIATSLFLYFRRKGWL